MNQYIQYLGRAQFRMQDIDTELHTGYWGSNNFMNIFKNIIVYGSGMVKSKDNIIHIPTLKEPNNCNKVS